MFSIDSFDCHSIVYSYFKRNPPIRLSFLFFFSVFPILLRAQQLPVILNDPSIFLRSHPVATVDERGTIHVLWIEGIRSAYIVHKMKHKDDTIFTRSTIHSAAIPRDTLNRLLEVLVRHDTVYLFATTFHGYYGRYFDPWSTVETPHIIRIASGEDTCQVLTSFESLHSGSGGFSEPWDRYSSYVKQWQLSLTDRNLFAWINHTGEGNWTPPFPAYYSKSTAVRIPLAKSNEIDTILHQAQQPPMMFTTLGSHTISSLGENEFGVLECRYDSLELKRPPKLWFTRMNRSGIFLQPWTSISSVDTNNGYVSLTLHSLKDGKQIVLWNPTAHTYFDKLTSIKIDVNGTRIRTDSTILSEKFSAYNAHIFQRDELDPLLLWLCPSGAAYALLDSSGYLASKPKILCAYNHREIKIPSFVRSNGKNIFCWGYREQVTMRLTNIFYQEFSEEMLLSVAMNPRHAIPLGSTIQIAPNPLSRETTIRYTIPSSGHVKLSVFDLFGRNVATLVDGEMEAGEQEFVFPRNDLPSGVYTCVVTSDGKIRDTKKLIVR